MEEKYKISKQRNPEEKLGRGEWTNWGGTSGQTGGAPRSALAATKSHLLKLAHGPSIAPVPQNPIIYAMCGVSINIFSARSL